VSLIIFYAMLLITAMRTLRSKFPLNRMTVI